MNHLTSVLFASALLAGPASAQILFHTGFETAPYVVGQPIDGIDGWFSFISPAANEVVNGRATASWSRRALTCWGGDPDLETTQGLLDGAWAQTLLLDPAYGNNVIVHVQCDVRLDGPDTGNGPQNDLLSANLYARNGVGGSAFMYMSSTGEVFCFADAAAGSTGYAFATPITLGRYSTLGITLNYVTHMATFSVNYRPVGTLPFGGQAGEFFRGATLEFAAYDNPAVIDPSLYTGYWDNLWVAAMPLCF
jgi:hypothetical protein